MDQEGAREFRFATAAKLAGWNCSLVLFAAGESSVVTESQGSVGRCRSGGCDKPGRPSRDAPLSAERDATYCSHGWAKMVPKVDVGTNTVGGRGRRESATAHDERLKKGNLLQSAATCVGDKVKAVMVRQIW